MSWLFGYHFTTLDVVNACVATGLYCNGQWALALLVSLMLGGFSTIGRISR